MLITLCDSEVFGQQAPVFSTGERLVYQLRWCFIPAGQVILEISPQKHEMPDATYHFVMEARTYPVVDLIYKYRERIDSYTSNDVQHTLLYKKVQQSNTPRDIVVNFDWSRNEAKYSNFGSPLPPITVEPGTLDPLSALYYIRIQDMKKNTTFERPVTDGKETVLGKASYVKKETISILGRRYETYKIEPELKHLKGVFEKSKDAHMYIWLTADERRLLVRLKSEVAVGSFTADLVDYSKK